ncbi:MAG: porin family protein [Lacinutrix sp.]|uniref:porin family protein n=1 Tax=Lacinutrix sp. TaxID=1937692 RepID=UPI0030997BE1
MRKTTLLLAFLLVSLFGFSQNALYGVRAGINISDLNFEEEDGLVMPDHSHRNGFAIGFFGDYKLSDNIGLLVELQFSAEGSKEKYDQIDQESGYSPESLRLDFVQIPIMAKIKLNDKLSLGLGPQVGLKVHAYEDSFRNIHFSGIAGLEYMISDEFFLDIRYSHGFTNIFDDNVGVKATNENIQIGFGLKI